ncbi:hypothetical protein FQR65_LT15886 [Abscondita terminalis]|nr:hypothetical protein FQR65_LT15886 [Abscondita terminalis]
MSKKQNTAIKQPRYRNAELTERRNLKMARSIHAYVRGNTAKYYDWLKQAEISSIPQGPAIWICGDCHTGNLGPVANAEGKIDIEIRDLDQTVIGNPANDLIRLGLSLATAVRSSDLPGVVTAQMIEALYAGYIYALERSGRTSDQLQRPALVHSVMEKAVKRSWKSLAKERLEDVKPQITLGKRFWPLLKKEQLEIHNVFAQPDIEDLVKMIGQRDASAQLKVIDSAYWVKGCSSLGLLRYIVLMDSSNHIVRDGKGLCLMDLKEATTALAPRYSNAPMPKDNAMRIVEGARHLSPYLGFKIRNRGHESNWGERFGVLFGFCGRTAHVRQMDDSTRNSWLKELQRNQSKTIDAPFWLWRSIVELISVHEAGYLDHCRRYALAHQK